MNIKNNNITYYLGIIIVSAVVLLTTTSVKAVAGDTSGSVYFPSGGCEGEDSCWPSLSASGYTHELYGIRVTVVDGDGKMVSARSIDYIGGAQEFADYINNRTTYMRCINSNRNRLGYLRGEASCNWKNHDGTTIAKYLSWLPDIFTTSGAATDIKSRIIGMNEAELNETFFNDIGYNVNRQNAENHYLIIEPITLIEFGTTNRTMYYGTYYELGPKSITTKHVYTLGAIFLPNSIYSIGNTQIKGPGGYKDETYFNGRIKIAKSAYTYTDGKGRTQVYQNYINDQSYAYGLGIYWLGEFDELIPQTCDYDNPSHFETSNSGPNGENCCEYVLDNLSTYGIISSYLFSKYPYCRSALLRPNECTLPPVANYLTCDSDKTHGTIKDISNWSCIYASAYSNDEKTKNYFLKYGNVTDECSVYCRDELEYYYPKNNMIALAGNHFTISSRITKVYDYGINNATNKLEVNAATLGPVNIKITRQCKILGEANNECKEALAEQLQNIQAPTIEFSYESKFYNNPTLILKTLDKPLTSYYSDIKYGRERTVRYGYTLPDDTYKYVSKSTGISHKSISTIGKYPYLTIDDDASPHAPIHFTEAGDNVKYQLTITDFNSENFNRYILNGEKMSTTFSTSVETYIKTILESGRITPTNINGLYYLDQTFIKHLNNIGYSVNDVLNSPCGNTDNYTCYSNDLGIYCYDKNTYSNSEKTYAYFTSCINNEVQKLNETKVSYQNDMLYECYFTVENPGDNQEQSGIDVIFRPISLSDPFPGSDAKGRSTGTNWCNGINDCSNTSPIVTDVITNNRGVTAENIYKERGPLYTITLDPSLIKDIRTYNSKNPYDDFNLECKLGDNCKSKFIRESDFSSEFSGCGIKDSKTYDTQQSANRCASNDAW